MIAAGLRNPVGKNPEILTRKIDGKNARAARNCWSIDCPEDLSASSSKNRTKQAARMEK